MRANRPSIAKTLLLPLLLLAGCHLVDQTTFGAAPRPPAPDALAAALRSNGTAPLLVILPDTGQLYLDALRQTVQAAEAANSDAHWRLQSAIPAVGDLAAQQAALDATAAYARQVLDDMGNAGIAPDRVTLSAITDPRLRQREIRLFQG